MLPATERFEWQASPVSGRHPVRLEPPRCKKRKVLDDPVYRVPVQRRRKGVVVFVKRPSNLLLLLTNYQEVLRPRVKQIKRTSP